jgi:hypothetical protein
MTVLAGVIFWSGNTSSPQFDELPWATMLLVAGFLLFALAAAQAAKTIALLKERTA